MGGEVVWGLGVGVWEWRVDGGALGERSFGKDFGGV